MQLVEYSKPDLYKFCSKKHNVGTGCNSLRVGTLWGFREEENALLKDEGEGAFLFHVDFGQHVEVQPLWLEQFKLEGGAANVKGLRTENGKTLISGFDFSGSAINAWIYCVSEGKEAIGNVSLAHESKWSIVGKHVQDFGHYLGSLIWDSLTLSDLPRNLVASCSIQDIQKYLSLNVGSGHVIYMDRNQVIGDPAQLGIEDIRQIIQRIPFLKPKRFFEEREFRFVFSLMYKNQPISISGNPKILNLRPVDKFITIA